MRFPVLAALILGLILCVQTVQAEVVLSQPAPALTIEHSPRFLVHLLDYLAQDYGGSVNNGKVSNLSEYNEQVEFVKTAIELSENLNETKNIPEIGLELKRLQMLIDAKASEQKVAALARKIQAEVLKRSGLQVSPSQWPNIQHGRQLFTQNCISCHGADGRGDGPAAASLEPKPANFWDTERMRNVSPFQAFNAIRLGVPGTAMTPYHGLSDKDIWDLAFYLVSIRHEPMRADIELALQKRPDEQGLPGLNDVATSSDNKLMTVLHANEGFSIPKQLAILRLYIPKDSNLHFLAFAKGNLQAALEDYKQNKKDEARKKALIAYLEGVEPVEPRLKANDPQGTLELEHRMAEVRMAIDNQKPWEEVSALVQKAHAQLAHAEQLLQESTPSPWLAFFIAAGILLREGFEAILVILALLGVIRASGSQKAERWVHGGWIAAVAFGLLSWGFSGWLMQISGAGRELMEAIISLLAVGVLLCIGFWLHSRTEIHRWRAFIDGQVRSALESSNLIGLALISFIAVFREAFETVLFLRAVWIEAGPESKTALGAGVFGAFSLVLILAWLLLRYSARIPIRRLFTLSSTLMVVLAFILTGKGFHSLQECGLFSITPLPVRVHLDLLGFYPTLETASAQLMTLVVSFGLWIYGKRPGQSLPSQKVTV